MARLIPWVLALIVACVPAALDASAQGRSDRPQGSAKDGKDAPPPANERERWKWWLYDRAELGITDQQSQDINRVFETTIPKLRESREELDRAEKELSLTIKEHKADLAVVSLQLDRVENARSQHNKMRTLMLYRMHLILSAEQRAKLEALRERRDNDRRDNDRRDKGSPADRRRHP